MHILQNTLPVSCRLEPEEAGKLLIPRPGKIFNRKVSGNQGLLKTEPKEDVQTVAHLIGIDTDAGSPNLVDCPDKSVETYTGSLGGEDFLKLWIVALPELRTF